MGKEAGHYTWNHNSTTAAWHVREKLKKGKRAVHMPAEKEAAASNQEGDYWSQCGKKEMSSTFYC